MYRKPKPQTDNTTPDWQPLSQTELHRVAGGFTMNFRTIRWDFQEVSGLGFETQPAAIRMNVNQSTH